MRVVGLAHTMVDHHLALVAADDETFREGHDFLDTEALTRVVVQGSFDFTEVIAEDYLTLICAHQDLTLREPAVSCVIL